ncbi:MAG TPA: hypothetical protein VFJ64_11975, partial [Solirubrobacterales bacterium]|nr:hypothetical protein [Solirubrobacterales bacterium]
MAEERGGMHGRTLPLVAIPLMALLVTLVALNTAAASGRRAEQQDLILRLHDLSPGYLNVELHEESDDGVFCSRLTHPRGTPPALASFIARFHPKGCMGAYYRLFAVPGQPPEPVAVGTGVLSMKTDRASDAAWHVVPELLGRLFHDRRPRAAAAPEKVGSATRMFHTAQVPGFYPFYRKLGHTTSFLVWRSGNTLAVVATVGGTLAEDDRAAVSLARRQQAHIRKASRYTRAERYDAEVPLDDPAIEMPVYWLGRHFQPQGLVGERLFQAYFMPAPRPESKNGPIEEGPLAPLFIGYGDITLDTWTPATWAVFADSRTGQALVSWKCTRTRTISLPDRTATIFAGYERD